MFNILNFAMTIQEELNQIITADLTERKSTANIQFRIFADMAKYKQADRALNSVTTYINGCLTTDTTDVTTLNNELAMAVISLTFEFITPTKAPRGLTLPDDDGQHTFPLYIRNIIQAYFSQNKAYTVVGETGKMFTGGAKFELLNTGVADMPIGIGTSLTYSAGITYYLVEKGVNSSAIKIELDGVPLPFENAVPTRSPAMQSDVSSNGQNYISKNYVTSSAFAVDVTMPSVDTTAGRELLSWLLDGVPNMAHFLKITWGTLKTAYYLITFGDVNASVTDIKSAGHTFALTELKPDADVITYPSYFYAGKLTVAENATSVILQTLSNCLVFVSNGKIYDLSTSGNAVIEVNKDDFGEDGTLLVLANKAVTFTVQNGTLTTIQSGGNNA